MFIEYPMHNETRQDITLYLKKKTDVKFLKL